MTPSVRSYPEKSKSKKYNYYSTTKINYCVCGRIDAALIGSDFLKVPFLFRYLFKYDLSRATLFKIKALFDGYLKFFSSEAENRFESDVLVA